MPATNLRPTDRAEVLRETARDLLDKADALDGETRCVCGHIRRSHDPAGWNQGWCGGFEEKGPRSEKIKPGDGSCECEEFEAW